MEPESKLHSSAQASTSKVFPGTIAGSLLLIAAGFPLVQTCREIAARERPHVFNLFRQWPSKATLHAWDQTAKDHSIFGKAIRDRVLQGRFDALGDMGSKALPGKRGWLFYRPDADYLVQPGFDEARFYDDTYDTLVEGQWVNPRNPLVAIRRFRDQLKARGIDLLVVPIPGKASIYPENLGRAVAAVSPAPTFRFQEALRAENIATVDLREVLLQAKRSGQKDLYLAHDTHWTPAGIRLAAKCVAAALREMRPDLAAPDSALRRRYGMQSVEAGRFGDIAEMTKLPKRRAVFGTQKIPAEQVWDSTSNAPYRDDPDSPILWLGDSFSRIYQTDDPKSAGIIAHVARELGFPLTSVVNDGGASTVVREQLLRRPEALRSKKIVVWTFVERDIRFGDKGWRILDLPVDSLTARGR